MTPTIAMWVLGISIVPLIVTFFYLIAVLKENNHILNKLLDMHEHPENTGFGTVGIGEVIAENTIAIKALTHYVKWLAEQRGTGEPPPPLE